MPGSVVAGTSRQIRFSMKPGEFDVVEGAVVPEGPNGIDGYIVGGHSFG